MEVRKNRLDSVIARPTNSGRGNLRKQLLAIGTWLVIFSLLAQPVLALTVNVRIEGPEATIFDGKVITTSTTVSGETFGPNIAVSALEAAAKTGGFKVEYTPGPFITSIAGIANKADWSESWLYRLNNNFNDVAGVGAQTIEDNNNLLFFYSAWPWPLPPQQPLDLDVLDKDGKEVKDIKVGEQLTLKTTYYDDDTGTFQPISATVKIGGSSLETDSSGQATTTLSNTGSYSIYAEKPGYIRSSKKQVVAGQVTTSPSDNSSDTSNPSNSSSSSQSNTNQNIAKHSSLTSARRKIYIHKALDYLRKKQSKDGKIVNPAVSAWAAIAFASVHKNPNKLKRLKGLPKKKWHSLMDYLENYTKTLLNRSWLKTHSDAAKPLATDYARQIMAVYAARRNPRNFGGINLIKELAKFYNNNQFGDLNLVNDDIFALLALKAAKVKSTDTKVLKTVEFIVKNQHADGGFGYSASTKGASDVDTTSATIQALALARKTGVKNLDGVLLKAYDFLVSKQKADGGFAYSGKFGQSNGSSTAWASQAVVSFKKAKAIEGLSTANGTTPLHFVADLRQSDGGFGYGAGSGSDALTTAQVIPALAKKAWLIRW